MTEAFLSGITLLDLSRLLPGPLASWHLASLGARVVKIEEPQMGDYARKLGPADGETSYFYRRVNAGKEIVSLDLKSEEGRCAFLERVDEADLVLESFRPGVLERMGLGFDRIHEVNPRTCLVSITGYGREGSRAGKAGHDINYLALSGWLYELNVGHAEPIVPNVQIADVLGGALTAAFGAVSALLATTRTGVGSHMTVSMTDAMVASNVLPLAYARAGLESVPPGEDLLNGGVPCYGIYRTSDDRHIAIGALESKFWERLCTVLGRPDLARRHWQCGQRVGGPDAKAVRTEIEKIFASRTLSHWQTVFADVDCCVTPVLRMSEILGSRPTLGCFG